MRLAAYCRVSTEQDGQLESLENQKLFFEGFADSHGYELVEIYADEGISGRQSRNREAFLRMLADARAHRFELLAVKDVSRFSRNTVDFLNAVRELRALHIEVQFLSNNQTVLGNSEFILTIFSALAQEESANLSKRVRFGKRMNAQKGRVPNIVYGYDQTSTFTLVPNETEAETVREIFALYAETGWGVRRIAETLNARGVVSKRGCTWSPKTIRRMLDNPLYSGVLENNKTETVDFLTGAQRALPREEHFCHARPELALVPPALFEKAQREIVRRRPEKEMQQTPARHSAKHLFSGLIRCADCGRRFTRSVRTYRNTYVRWRCAAYTQHGAKGCANGVPLDEGALLQAVQDYLCKAAGDLDHFAAEIGAGDGARRAYDAAVKRAARQEQQRERWQNLYAEGLLTMRELRARLEKLDAAKIPLPAPPEPVNGAWVAQELQLERWTNAELRELIETIETGTDGSVTVRLRKLE